MPWFKIDDGFHGHPKVLSLTPADVGVWTLAGTWCASYLTDGVIPFPAVQRLGGSQENCDALVAAGLWFAAPGGYEFKDWEDYQPMKVDVEAEREASRERMRKVRAKRKRTTHERSDEQPPNVRPNIDERSDELRAKFGECSEEVRLTPTQPDPTRPDPTLTTSTEVVKERPAVRGSRLSPEWNPSPENIQTIRAECPGIDPELEHRVFVDYWIAQPGQKGVKVDWEATWRNWMRRKQSDVKPASGTRVTAGQKARSIADDFRRDGL